LVLNFRISGGELFERVIDDDFILTERLCELYMMQICEGVNFMHSCNIIHLDMKVSEFVILIRRFIKFVFFQPENILCLNRNGHRIKIIDFGLARKFDPTKQLKVLFGTPEFVAPEVINFDRVGYGTDMWYV
jgi:myosin-light-chain kinase